MVSKTLAVDDPIKTTKAINFVDASCTKIVGSGKIAYVTVSDEPQDDVRSSKDNAQFHAIMSDIWKQGVCTISDEYGDKKEIVLANYSFEACKTLLLVWFIEELKNVGEKIPAYMRVNTFIDPKNGKVYNERASTTKYSAKMCGLLNQFLWSSGIDDFNVKFTEPAYKEYENYREAQ